MVARCPLCGAPNAACGQRTTTDGVTIGRTTRVSDHTNFQKYEVEINGVKTTLRLSDQQAAARGLDVKGDEKPAAEAKKEPAKKAAPKAANKARTAKNK